MAPVVGETNLLEQSCCIIRPATLIPVPVHKSAKRRGSREAKKTVQSELKFSFLTKKSFIEISITPTKRETKLSKIKATAKINVIKFCFEKFFIVQKFKLFYHFRKINHISVIFYFFVEFSVFQNDCAFCVLSNFWSMRYNNNRFSFRVKFFKNFNY